MSTEARLAEYRARKVKEDPQFRDRIQRSSSRSEDKVPGNSEPAVSASSNTSAETRPQKVPSSPSANPTLARLHTSLCGHLSRVPGLRNLAYYRPEDLLNWQSGLTAVLWLIFWGLFIELEFGAVFFIISCFVFMYKFTRTRERLPGEASAYSVFNPDCERLDGTFTSDQFERQLGLGLARPPT